MSAKNKKTPHLEPEIGKKARLPSFASMADCEAATGIPKAAMQKAKREGCDAFDSHNRVSLEKLLRWMFSRDNEGEDWNLRYKRAQALTAEAELGRMQGSLVPIDDVYEQQRACVAKAVGVLKTKFETELPAKLDGAPATKIAEANSAAIEEVMSLLSRRETYV